jgi:hypothetical protein
LRASLHHLSISFVTVMLCGPALAASEESAVDASGIVAAREAQLEVLKSNIHRWACDNPKYATSVAGCRQLNAQAASLAASIEELKTGAPSTPSEAKAEEKKPVNLKMLTYRSQTNPSGFYRTYCVKLCDGSSIPMSYSTQPGNFLADHERCQSGCPSSPSKLFYSTTNQGLEKAVALDGQRYAYLPNAFRFRAEYVKDCQCKPEPWSDEAKADYERRAVEAARSPDESVVASGVSESAQLAANAEVVSADEIAPKPPRQPKALGRYRYSSVEGGSVDPMTGYRTPRRTYTENGVASRNRFYAGTYDTRGAYAPRRRGFFLFGSR